MRDTQKEKEAETQAEGEAGSMQGARRGTQSWVSRITPWAEGGAKTTEPPGLPKDNVLRKQVVCVQSGHTFGCGSVVERLPWARV